MDIPSFSFLFRRKEKQKEAKRKEKPRRNKKEVKFHVCCEASMAKIREILAHNDTSKKDKFLAIRRIILNGDLS